MLQLLAMVLSVFISLSLSFSICVDVFSVSTNVSIYIEHPIQWICSFVWHLSSTFCHPSYKLVVFILKHYCFAWVIQLNIFSLYLFCFVFLFICVCFFIYLFIHCVFLVFVSWIRWTGCFALIKLIHRNKLEKKLFVGRPNWMEWKIVLFALHKATICFFSSILSRSNCYCLTASNTKDIKANTKVNFALNSCFKEKLLIRRNKRSASTWAKKRIFKGKSPAHGT